VNFPPVITRELQVASRQRATWRMRLTVAAVALAAFVFGWAFPHVSPHERGQVVLICLAVATFVINMFAGAYLTADAISTEKRDGTLGLLFLTPLSGGQIVLGKLATHSLQAAYAWLAGIAVFFLPVLLGGVLWAEVARLLLVLLGTMLLSLACGLFWSTLCVESRTTVLATVGTMLLLVFLPWLPAFMMDLLNAGPSAADLAAPLSPMSGVIYAFQMNYRQPQPLAGILSGEVFYWSSVLLCFALAFGLTLVSAWLLPRRWRRTENESARTTATSGQAARRSAQARSWPPDATPLEKVLGRNLTRQPWLRILRGLLLGFIVLMLIGSVLKRSGEEFFITAFCTAYGLHFLTRLELAMLTTRRLQEDRRSGALELLFSTPLSDQELVDSQLRVTAHVGRRILWLALLANVLLEITIFVGEDSLHMDAEVMMAFSVFFLGGGVVTLLDATALRWLGIREALLSSTPLRALGRTLGWLVAVPWLAFAAAWLLAFASRRQEAIIGIFACWMVFCALYDLALIGACKAWVRGGLRHRLAMASS
jgi:ABC-type transport system involved in multi-copper enzyme maturation permease subunit